MSEGEATKEGKNGHYTACDKFPNLCVCQNLNELTESELEWLLKNRKIKNRMEAQIRLRKIEAELEALETNKYRLQSELRLLRGRVGNAEMPGG